MSFAIYRLLLILLCFIYKNIRLFAKWIMSGSCFKDRERVFQQEEGFLLNRLTTSTPDLESQLQESNDEWKETWRLNGGEKTIYRIR
jgi:hypothetical protein